MRQILLAATLALLAACGSAGQDSAAPDAATGFITENTAAPESATDSRGDGVLRDEDGRPYGYGLLGEKLPLFSAPMVGRVDHYRRVGHLVQRLHGRCALCRRTGRTGPG